jgi:PE family
MKVQGECMDSRHDRIAVELGGIVGGRTEGTIHGGRFTFDPDTIQQVINNWVELADSYAQARQDAFAMTQIKPPGDEFVSQSFAAKANASGESYIAYCKHNRDICRREAQRYQDALDTYLGAEERTIIEFGKTDDSGFPPVV